jgi:hypothetical protein
VGARNYGLSFFSENGMTVGEIAHLAGPSRLPHGYVRVSKVGKLRARGFHPYRSDLPPHVTIKWGIWPTDDELKELVRAFGEPIPNPLVEE